MPGTSQDYRRLSLDAQLDAYAKFYEDYLTALDSEDSELIDEFEERLPKMKRALGKLSTNDFRVVEVAIPHRREYQKIWRELKDVEVVLALPPPAMKLH